MAFISLGLPDAMLGSAWPRMHGELGAPVSYAGIISMIISIGTLKPYDCKLIQSEILISRSIVVAWLLGPNQTLAV